MENSIEEIKKSYDEINYSSFSFENSHPLHIGGVAKLFGLNPQDVNKSRILELGCASGGNIIPIAFYYPQSEVVGIDLSSEQVKKGKEFIKELGIKNIKIKNLSILDVDDSFGKFDYIICHGVFSWVPEEVQNKILQICHRNLAKDGLAYVSYNTHPGWNMVNSVKDMMRYHADSFVESEKVSQARLLLDFISESIPHPENPYALILKNEVDIIRKREDYYIRHEYLSQYNKALYFSDFVKMAAKNHLQYLGSSDLPVMYLGNIPQSAQEKLKVVTDPVRLEQYMDFIYARRFRSTILCHNNKQINRKLNADSLDGLDLFYDIKPLNVYSTEEIENPEVVCKFIFMGNEETSMQTSNVVYKKIFSEISSKTSISTKELFDLLESLSQKMNISNLRDDFSTVILKMLFSGYIKCKMQTQHTKVDVMNINKLCRLMASKLGAISTKQNVMMGLDVLEKMLIQYLDGSKSKDEIIEIISDRIHHGEFNIHEGERKIVDKEEIRNKTKIFVEEAFKKLEKYDI